MDVIKIVHDDHVMGEVSVKNGSVGKKISINGRWHLIKRHLIHGKIVDVASYADEAISYPKLTGPVKKESTYHYIGYKEIIKKALWIGFGAGLGSGLLYYFIK